MEQGSTREPSLRSRGQKDCSFALQLTCKYAWGSMRPRKGVHATLQVVICAVAFLRAAEAQNGLVRGDTLEFVNTLDGELALEAVPSLQYAASNAWPAQAPRCRCFLPEPEDA